MWETGLFFPYNWFFILQEFLTASCEFNGRACDKYLRNEGLLEYHCYQIKEGEKSVVKKIEDPFGTD
jgi:hypothetical protein